MTIYTCTYEIHTHTYEIESSRGRVMKLSELHSIFLVFFFHLLQYI